MITSDIIQKYWSLGLATLPTKQDKSPFGLKTWKGGVTDLMAYQNCFGIGVICGSISGNLECLDFDNHFGDAKENISQFIDEIGDLYKQYQFPIESTTSGGFHLLYRCERIEGNLKLASRPKYDEKSQKFSPDAIIETRGEGGYFVCAPTEGYEFVRNKINNIPTITIDDRSKLIQVAKSFNEWYELKKESDEQEGRPGDLFNNDILAIDECKKELTANGWYELKDGQWRRPNKKEGISATFGKVANNCFYVFSSNAYPFEPQKGYSPFQVIGLLRYKGNFSDFAKELAERYGVNKPQKKEYGKVVEKKKDPEQLFNTLKKSFIDLSIPVAKPPVIMKIRDFETGALWDKRLFTLGNFSAITGKTKSKKTFLISYLLTAACNNGILNNKIITDLPANKNGVILFDTEQSNYDAFVTANRIKRMLGYIPENFSAFAIREFSPIERCEIIDFALEHFKDMVSYVVIDGIADLANAINDEQEATRVVGLLMKWTKVYNCHITNVIHQNKNDNFATGHIGSSVMKKAEVIISSTKSDTDKRKSLIRCDNMRGGSEFNDFELEINDVGLPVINDTIGLSTMYEVKEEEF